MAVKLIIFLSFVYAVVALAIFPKWTVDDAYITMRYAGNLANSGALTWNVGEDPIEGYTGVLWPVILSGFMIFGVDPVSVSQIGGVAGLAISALLLLYTLRLLSVNKIIRAAILALYVTFPFIYSNTFSGLETMLFIALTSGSIAYFTRYLTSDKRTNGQLATLLIWLLLSCLARPEGVVLAFVIIATLIFVTYKQERARLASVIKIILLIFLLPALAYFIWRYSYYGYFLPNTFYAKARSGVHLNHIKDFIHFAATYLAVPIFSAVAVFLTNPDSTLKRLKEDKISASIAYGAVALAAFVGIILLQYTRSLLKMNFSYRFFVPFVPIALIFIGYFFELGRRELNNLGESGKIRRRALAVLLVIFGLFHILTVTHRLKDEYRFANDYKKQLSAEHIAAGRLLKQLPANEWLIILYDAGAVPFISGMKTIDMGGLNDEYIVHEHPDKAKMIEYFFSKHPGAAVFTSKDSEAVIHDPVAEAIVADARFGEYKLAERFLSPDGSQANYHLFVFVRKDLLRKNLL